MFSAAAFPVIVAFCYVIFQLVPNRYFGSIFGGINLLVVGYLFGLNAALMLAALAVLLWSALWTSNRFEVFAGRNSRYRNFIRLTLIALVLVSLFGHRLVFDFAFLQMWFSGLIATDKIEGVINVLRIIAFSYVALRMIDCVMMVSDGERLLGPIALSGYLMPFFMTPAGPINSYQDHVTRIGQDRPVPTLPWFVDCLFLISIGYFMKFFCADIYKLFFLALDGQWSISTVGDTYIILIYIMLEFWGYSLIALGVGRLLGIPTPVNFNHPYISVTFSEFWTRCHVSLGAFVSRNVYNPILVSLMRAAGRKRKRLSYFFNLIALLVPFIFVGLWHRASLSFLLWGIAVGSLVALEKVLRDARFMKQILSSSKIVWILRPLGIIYTQLAVAYTLHFAIRDFPL